MRINPKTNLLMLLALAVVLLIINSCRTDNVEVPPLTGPSGQRLFLTIQAEPDHLVIRGPGKSRERSTIVVQLKNQLGQGVPNETVKLRIANREGSEVNIGRLSQLSGVTDAGGFIRVTYTAPNTLEQRVATGVYILAIMTNPSFTNEVTDTHAIDLEFAQPPINCVGNGPGAPIPAFTVTPSSPAVNEVACFDAQSSTDNGIIVAASWDFGDGSKGAGLNVCHTFTHDGNFNVSLTVQDDDHNCATITQVVTVTNEGPTCQFNFSPTTPQIGENVQFNAAESTDPESNLTSFQWNFGDGGTASGKVVNHTFNSEGTFTVTLTVRDNQGETSVCTQTITIGNQPPLCNIVVSPTGTVQPGQSITLDGSGSSDPDNDSLDFQWSVPGAVIESGDTSSSSVTIHYNTTGSFTVTLKVTDQNGAVSTCNAAITVGNAAPTCSFTAPTTVNLNQDAILDASGSFDPDGDPITFNWSVPGANIVSGTTVSQVLTVSYSTSGEKNVTLTVTDSHGKSSTPCSKTITVGSAAPVCGIATNPDPPIVNTGGQVTFTSTATDDNGIATITWEFNDGNAAASGPGPINRTFTATCTPAPCTDAATAHQVTQTVTDVDGNTCNTTTSVTVNNP